MKSIVSEAFSLHLLLLKILCLLPFENKILLFRVQSILKYFVFTTLLPILSIVSFVTTESFDFAKVAQSAFITIELFIFIFKHLPFVIYGQQMMNIIKSLDNSIFKDNLKTRQKIILNDINSICKRVFWFYLFCVTSACILLFSSAPLETEKRTIPVSVWTPYNSKKWYIAAYFFTVIGVADGAYASAGYDTLVAGLVFQVAGQVQVLKDNLQHLAEDANDELEHYSYKLKYQSQLKNFIIYKKIRQCVIHHDHIMSFITEYERYFSLGVFMQFLGSGLVICLSVFELTIIEPFSYTFLFICVYTNTILFQIFIYCIFGTALYEESNTITTSIYMGNWYEYDIKSRKALILLMEKANKPILVTAGTILDLSLTTFTTVLRRAYSFYAVLRQYK